MLKKSHVFVLGLATAGLIGFTAPMASAATTDDPGSSLVNVSNNQVPVQVCGNDVNTNGAGTQVLAEGGSAVVPLLSPGSFNKSTAYNNRGCAMLNNQQNRHGENGSSLVNLSNNQVPVQVCGNDANTNGDGVQVPLEALGILVPVLSPGSVNLNKAVNNRGCISANNQENGKHGGHGGHGSCPCHGGHPDNGTSMTSDQSESPADQSESPANGSARTSGLSGLPVNGSSVSPGLAGLPAVGGITSGLQSK